MIEKEIGLHDSAFFEEPDTQFVERIFAIKEKKESLTKGFCSLSEVSEEQCERVASIAQLHCKANRINSTSVYTNEKIRKTPDIQLCNCGCEKAAGDSFSITTNQQNFTFLGPGVILFFFFIKSLRILLLTFIISYAFFALVTNILSAENLTFQVCLDKANAVDRLICQLNSVTTFNLKRSLFLKQMQLWLGMFGIILWMLGFNFVEYLGFQKNQQIDNLLDSSSDYTIQLQDLPEGQFTQHELLQFIQELWNTKENISVHNFEQRDTQTCPLKLKGMHVIYNMGECRQMLERIKQSSIDLCSYFNEEKKLRFQDQDAYNSKKMKLLRQLSEIEQLRMNFKASKELRKKQTTSCALVYFSNPNQQKQFLKYYSQQFGEDLGLCNVGNDIKFKDQKISISRAPEPSDFNWENCEKKFSYLRYSLIWGVTLLILYSAFTLVSYIQTLDFITSEATIVISIIVQLFNRILWVSLSLLVTLQYHNTKTQVIKSLMSKSLVAQIINVVIAPMANNFISSKPFYGENSISSISLYYQFIMFFMMFIFYVANPLYYLKLIVINIKYFRKIMIRKLCPVVGKIDTVEEIKPVLIFYEGPQFPIAGAYVYLATAMIHTFFYCHLQPLLILIFLFNLLGFNLIMKYLLYQRCKVPDLIDFQIFKFAIFSMKLGCLFYGLGGLTFMIGEHLQTAKELHAYDLIPSCICILLFLVSHFDCFQLRHRINKVLFKFYSFQKNFDTDHNDSSKLKADNIFAEIIIKALENLKVVYERKQSYYTYSNLQKLFNFERELRQVSDIENIKRNQELQEFCESFVKKSKETEKIRRKQNKRKLDLAINDLLFFPVEQETQGQINISADKSRILQIGFGF